MKTQSVALAAHRAGGTTTLAYCWRLERLDGQIFRFTSLDVNLEFEGELYLSAQGFTPSPIQNAADLSVTNLDVVGPINTVSIEETDVIAGLWDAATVEVFEVNYRDMSQGRMKLLNGKLGNLNAGQVQFEAEQRGIEQAFQQPFGRVFAPTCDATLGDARCGVHLPALTVAGTVTAVTSRREFVASALAQATDFFGGGLVEWTAGANVGVRMEVQRFIPGGAFELVLQLPYDLQVGDTFTVSPGCRKRRNEDCRDKFANAVNFRGFPDIPGNNRILGSANQP